MTGPAENRSQGTEPQGRQNRGRRGEEAVDRAGGDRGCQEQNLHTLIFFKYFLAGKHNIR